MRSGDQVHEYVQLVEGHREGGKVRQRVVATLGRLDELKASGQLDRWAGAFTRLDPPPLGTRREVGPLLVVGHYLRRLGLVGLVDQMAPMRGRSLLTHGEVIATLVANRLAAPAPLYDVAGWASSAAVAELFDVPAGLLNDDRLGRALDALGPRAEDLRGRLLLRTIERCHVDAGRLHLDLTAVRFAGSYEQSSVVKKGWSADRSIGRQVKTLQASTKAGVTMYFRPHQGASSELPAFMTAIETLAAALPPGLVVVADSGLGYLENLCAVDASNVGFVVPLRADTGWAQRFVDDVRPACPPSVASTTAPNVSSASPPSDAPAGKGCCVASRSLPATEPPTTCASPTSGPPKRPPPSPMPAGEPWTEPKKLSAGSATGSAGATTRPKTKSSQGRSDPHRAVAGSSR